MDVYFFSYQSLAYGDKHDKRRIILKVLLSYAYQQLNVTKYNNYGKDDNIFVLIC